MLKRWKLSAGKARDPLAGDISRSFEIADKRKDTKAVVLKEMLCTATAGSRDHTITFCLFLKYNINVIQDIILNLKTVNR